MDFIKMSNLVGSQFVFKSILKGQFKKWDDENKTMLTRDTWDAGYRFVITVETDKGQLDIGEGQLGTMLKAFFDKDTCTSNIKNGIVEVKSNGKTGQDIRYFFNRKGYATNNENSPMQEQAPIPVEEDECDISNLPF